MKKIVSLQQLSEIRAYVLAFGCYANGEMTLKEATIYFDLLIISEGFDVWQKKL